MNDRKYIILENALLFYSSGLKDNCGFEFKILKKGIEQKDCIIFIDYLLNYIYENKVLIKNGETLAYYSWLVKFSIEDNYFINVFELDPNSHKFILGIQYSSRLLKDQLEICSFNNVLPDFPLFGNYIVVYPNVYESNSLECIRYEKENDNCGWYVTSPDYNGDYTQMRLDHFSHFALKKFNLLKYLALPAGYFIIKHNNEFNVQFDQSILNE